MLTAKQLLLAASSGFVCAENYSQGTLSHKCRAAVAILLPSPNVTTSLATMHVLLLYHSVEEPVHGQWCACCVCDSH